jgi:hypothetical protein
VGDYTYTFVDIPSGQKIASLPLYGVSASDFLYTAGNGASAGMFTGSIRMDSDFASVSEILDMTRVEATAVWMDRLGTPIWGGILWTRTYQSDGRVMQLNAQSFSSYFSKVVWYPTRGYVAGANSYNHKDNPHNVIRFLAQYLSYYASPEYDIGLQLEPYHQTGDPDLQPNLYTTVNFALKDRKFLSSYITDMLALGAEYRIRPCLNDQGERVALFESGFAGDLGLTAQAADGGESYEYPGEIAKYWLTNSSANAPTRLFGVGQTTGTDDVLSLRQGSTVNRIGVDAVATYDTVDVAMVATRAAGDLISLQNDLNRPVYDIAGDQLDMEWSVGDHRRMIIDDPQRFSEPMSGVVRLTGWQLTPKSSEGVEQLSITIDDPTFLEAVSV